MHWNARRPPSRAAAPPPSTSTNNTNLSNSSSGRGSQGSQPAGMAPSGNVSKNNNPVNNNSHVTAHPSNSSAPSPLIATLPDSPYHTRHTANNFSHGNNMAQHLNTFTAQNPSVTNVIGNNTHNNMASKRSSHISGNPSNNMPVGVNNNNNVDVFPGGTNANFFVTAQSTPQASSSSLHNHVVRRSTLTTTSNSVASGVTGLNHNNTNNTINTNNPHSSAPPRREAVSISGAHTAAANATHTGIFMTGTRTTYTNAGWHHFPAGAGPLPGGVSGPGGTVNMIAGGGVNAMHSTALTNAALTANMADFGNLGVANNSGVGVAPPSLTSVLRNGMHAQHSPPQQGSVYGMGHGLNNTMMNPPPGTVSGDPAEEELMSLFIELQSALAERTVEEDVVSPSSIPHPTWNGVGSQPTSNKINSSSINVSHFLQRRSTMSSNSVEEILVDLIAAIETRSLASLDPNSRDFSVEYRIRDLLSELRHVETNDSLFLSVHVIELLLPIDYTSPSHKFIRFCRALSNILQCPLDAPRKEAQRVFGLMLEYDAKYHSEPPLKAYLSRELREQVGIANLHLQARAVNNNRKQYPTQLLYFVMMVEEIAKVSPRYIPTPSLRDDIIRIATACCVSEPQLEAAAYQCLLAVFKSSSVLNPKDIIRENKMVCSKCEILNSARYNEVSVICQLKVLRALFSSRPSVLNSEKVKISAAVTAQFAPSKSPEVRMAVCDLLPIIAPWDIQNPSRRNAYCALIMEPVKNVRDNRRKSEELNNIAHFIRVVGYHVLDAASRNNLDSILLRYIAMPDIQEACWRVIAAILTNTRTPPNGHLHLPSIQSGGISPSHWHSGSHHRGGGMSETGSRRSGGNINSSSSCLPFSGSLNHSGIGPSSEAPVTVVPSSTEGEGAAAAPSDAVLQKIVVQDEAPTGVNSSVYPSSGTETPLAGAGPEATTASAYEGVESRNHHCTPPLAENADEADQSSVSSPVVPVSAGEGGDSYPVPPPGSRSGSSAVPLVHGSQHSGGTTPHNRYRSGSSPTPTSGSNSRLMHYTAEDLVGRCVPFIRKAQLTAELVELLNEVKEAIPSLSKPIRNELNELVEMTLAEAAAVEKEGTTASPQREGVVHNPAISSNPAAMRGMQSVFGGSSASSFHMAVAASMPHGQPTAIGNSRFVNPKEGATSIVHISALTSEKGTTGVSTRKASSAEGFHPASSTPSGMPTTTAFHRMPRSEVGEGDVTTEASSPHRSSGGGDPTTIGLMNLAGSSMASSGQPTPPRRENDLAVALDLVSKRSVTSITELNEFAASIASFQRHPDPKVRRGVYRAMMRWMASWIHYAKERRESSHSAVVIGMLEAYIRNAPLELNSSCRQEAVKILATTDCFRPYLADSRILTVLHGFLSSTPRTREIAVDLLYAITHNVKTSLLAPIHHALGITVDACVMVLEYSDDTQMLFRGMEDLRSYTKLGVRFLTGHLTRIFRALQKRLEDPQAAEMIVLCALKTLDCVLAAIIKDERSIFRYEDDILLMYPVAVNTLCRNSSHAINLASVDVLVSLNNMMSSPTPFVDHQTLVDVVTRVYNSTNSTRKEVVNILTLLGQMGAVDPSLRDHEPTRPAKRLLPSASGLAVTNPGKGGVVGGGAAPAVDAIAQNAASRLSPQEHLTFDAAAQDYTVIVYKALSQLVGSSHAEAVSTQALRTLLQFVRFTQDQKNHVDGVMAAQNLVQIAKRNKESPTLRIEALRVLAAICSLRHEKIVRTMLPEIVVLLEQVWAPTDYSLFSVTLDVVSALKPGKLSEKEHSESWEWLYPRLMDVAVQDRSETRELCLRVVEIVLTASYIPPHCLPIIFPVLQRFMQQSGQLVEVRSQALCAAVHLVFDLKAPQYTTSLMQGIRTIIRHCELYEDLGPRLATVGMIESLKVLSALLPSARQVIRQFLEYLQPKNDLVDPSRAVVSPSPPPGSTYGINVVSNGLGTTSNMMAAPQSSLPPGRTSMRPENVFSDEEDEEAVILAVPEEMPTPNAQDIAVFLKHIDWGATRKKMRDWFSELQKYIILVSPHPAIRMMADLVSKHDPLRRELFNPSFKAIYEVLNAEQIRKVNAVMTSVLNGNDTELTSQCLALADYLDHHPPSISAEVIKELQQLEAAEAEGKLLKVSSALPVASGQGELGSSMVIGGSQLIPQLPNFGLHNNRSSTSFSVHGVNSTTQVPFSATHGVENNGHHRSAHTSIDQQHSANAAVLQNPHNDVSARDSFTTISTMDFKSASTSSNNRHPMESTGVLSPNPQGVDLLLRRHTEAAYCLNLHHEHGSESLMESPAHAKGLSLHYLSPVGRLPLNPYPTGPKINLFTPENIVKAVERTRLYDKAFNYFESRLLSAMREYQFHHMPWDVVHSIALPLAWLYNKRDMHTSVIGLFDAIQYKGETDAGRGYELLGAWEDAQRVYARAIGGDLGKITLPLCLVEGYIRSLFFLAEWGKAFNVALSVPPETLRSSFTISRCGTTAAWILGRWDDVASLSNSMVMNERSSTHVPQLFVHIHQLHKAVVCNEMKEYEALRVQVKHAKLSLDETVRTLLPLSYSHAYDQIAVLQHYTEIEELVDYCTSKQPKRLLQLLQRWESRFKKLKARSPQPTLNTLLILSVVLSTREMSSMILHFCEAMSGEYPKLTQWAMNWLQDGVLPSSTHSFSLSRFEYINSNPEVNLGYINHMWSQGRREEAMAELERFLQTNRQQLEKKSPKVYASAELKLGKWKQELLGDGVWSRQNVQEEFGHFYRAIRADPSSYEAWHSWALINYRVQQQGHESVEEQRRYVEAAHQGFAASICRCQCAADALPAIMRLLQLWVIYNGVALLKEMVADIISRIPVDYWVQAIPQLIGHLTSDSHDIREVITMILRLLCEKHPQAVIFPLLVVNMSDEENVMVAPQQRKKELVRSIIQHCPKQVRMEAEMVAKLLVDVSAIPIEKIREHLSEVAAAWNPNTEFEVDREEVSHHLRAALEIFNANSEHLLYTVGEIGTYVRRVMENEANGNTVEALTTVKQLVEEISKHVANGLGKEPQKAMAPLLRLRNLTIAVFGQYDIADAFFPTITSFSSALDVIPSKKRPRKIQLSGSDGQLYSYCLKGNEDIRMDERVMQLFGMVNVLLQHAQVKSASSIHRFPVIPISSSVGLLGWVQNASTINSVICDYRVNVSRMRTDQESSVWKAYVDSIGQWEKLSIIQRTEALDFVMHQKPCAAMDVANAMWFCANTAEQWLDRRITYTISLATMSMVGYVLGLGDRHLGNILLSMSTGKVVHIDFGDSFEVGRLRHVLPETVPFRLTLMLSNAMEVFGVNGSFRANATRTQHILRGERDSIMSLLSAFIYDPIVQHKRKVKSIMEKSRTPRDVVERIRRKLHGTELAVPDDAFAIYHTTPESSRRPDLLYMSKVFDAEAPRCPSKAFSTEKQVNFLIDESTRIDNYTVLFVGWGPLW